MTAKRDLKWTCGENEYILVAGKKADIKKTDIKQAIASGLFEEVKES